MNYLEEYYSNYDEEGRLLSQHGQVEYLTTQKYIHECIRILNCDNSDIVVPAGISDPAAVRILEVGAGTGRYSIALAKEGYQVTAVELVKHNIELLRQKLDGTESLTVHQGNALDLAFLPSESFDLTLVLGPMYHLYDKAQQLRALSEAVRVTRPGGFLLVAYCMNEPTVIQYIFGQNHLREVLDFHMVTSDWHCISTPKDLFQLTHTEDIEALDKELDVDRVKLVASDGATKYMQDLIDEMDADTFRKWMDYHFTICERQDLIGASHHTLDILRKRNNYDVQKDPHTAGIKKNSDILEIREALVSDAQELAELCREAMGYDCDVAQVTDALRRLDRTREQVYTAVSNGQVLGFVHVEKYQVLYFDLMANILGLAVSHKARHQGIGTALMQAAEAWAKALGITSMRLNSGAGRKEAHAFYKAIGYMNNKEQYRFIKLL